MLLYQVSIKNHSSWVTKVLTEIAGLIQNASHKFLNRLHINVNADLLFSIHCTEMVFRFEKMHPIVLLKLRVCNH